MPAASKLPPALARLATGALDLLWPERCVGCDTPGTLLCEDCAKRLPTIDRRWACPFCGAPFGWLVCTDCTGPSPELPRIVSAFAHEGAAARLVTVYKDEHERRLAPLLAEAIHLALHSAFEEDGEIVTLDAIAFIPSTEEALARRGFDPMQGVARELSARIDLPVADALIHYSSGDQRELTGEERAENVRGSFEATGDVFGARLLLIDDVVTTGSSLREAARALAARGARVALAASVTRVW